MRWLLVLVPIVVLVATWLRRRSADERQRQLMLLCQRAGLGFAPLDLRADTAWLPFAMFGRSPSGTENVVWDESLGKDVYAFDFWYRDVDDEGSIGVRHRLTCAVVPLPATCPRIRVTPRGSSGDAAGPLEGSEVRLELEAFDRRFRVEAEDERAAVAFLDQRMMEALLALPAEVAAEVSEDVLLLRAPELPPERVLLLFDAACRLRRHIPRVVASLYPHRPEQGGFEHRWLQGRWSPDPTGADAPGRATSR